MSIIPHTAKETTLLSKKVGDVVNLENDVIGKYVEKLLDFSSGDNTPSAETSLSRRRNVGQSNNSGISEDFLMRNGFM